jgi:hypothetical protein
MTMQASHHRQRRRSSPRAHRITGQLIEAGDGGFRLATAMPARGKTLAARRSRRRA